MATPTIPNGEEHFFPIIYSGNGQGQRVGKFVPFTDDGTIVKSVMYNDNDNPYLTRTQESGTGDQKRKATFSWWFKRGSSYGTEMIHVGAAPATRLLARFDTSNRLVFRLTNGTSEYQKVTNMTFEDSSKWYHCHWQIDVSQSTATDRSKVWINGDQITSWSSDSNPGQNTDVVGLSDGTTQRIGCGSHFVGQIFDGYLAEFNYCDGVINTVDNFGVTDTASGRWIPKTVVPSPSSTYTYTITVVSGNPSDHPYYNFGSTNKYAIDGSTATGNVALQLVEGATYKFDQSDSSNSGHPLRFSTTPNGSWGGGSEYTTGVTTSGTPGNSGAYTQITVASGAPTLYYYCTNHSGMGWSAETPTSGITYGTNGFRLKFQDSSALGDDNSGNTNDFSSSGLTASDQRNDTPTNNLPTMRPYNPSYNTTQAQGNLQYTPTGTNAGYPMCATLRPNSGKWYAEVRTSSNGGGNVINMGIYIQEDMHFWDNSANYYPGGQMSNGDGCGAGLWVSTGTNYLVSSTLDAQIITSNPTYSLSAGDVFGIAVDRDNDLVSFYGNNGSLIGSTSILRPGSIIFTAMAVTSSDTWNWNFGDNPTFDGNETAGGNSDSDGNGNFYHSVPTGFKMLRQQSMPETARGVTGLAWVKNRDATNNNAFIDSSRGQSKNIFPDSTGAEQDYDKRGLSKFLKGGFSVGEYNYVNGADNKLVSWNWVANGGTTSSNTDGSITSTTQVNSTAGFSIVQYSGNSGSVGTIGHGLSSKPEWIIIKDRDASSYQWMCQHTSLGATHYVELSTTNPFYDNDSIWNDTEPTSSVFTIGTNAGINSGTNDYIAYCWHSVDGYSKFGKYTGNNNADGPFVYTGFTPAFVMLKRVNGSDDWYILDSAREPNNPKSLFLEANTYNAEASAGAKDFLSNGFKIRDTNFGNLNEDYVYMAWAEHPFVGDGTNPVTAR